MALARMQSAVRHRDSHGQPTRRRQRPTTRTRRRRRARRRCSATSARYHRPITANARGAEVLRRRPDAALRLQSRRGVPLVRAGGGARSEGADAALGHVARARHQLQRHGDAGSVAAGVHASDACAGAGRQRQRRRARVHRRAGQALCRHAERRQSAGARSRRTPRDGRGLEAVPRRSRCRDALCREHDEPAAVEALHLRWGDPEPGTDRDRRDARERDEAQSESSGREPLSHSRRRSVAARPSAACRAPSGSRRSCPPPVISCTCRRTSGFAPATTSPRSRPTTPRPRSTRST